MIRVTLIEATGHVLYTLNSDYELENVSRTCSFLTSPFAIKEIQNREPRTVHAGNHSVDIRPLPEYTWFTHETYDNLKRILSGHSLPAEGKYIAANMEESAGDKIPLQLIHDDYVLFCRENYHEPMALKRFGKALREKYGMMTRQSSYKNRNITCVFNYKLK